MHDLHVIQGPDVTRDVREKIAFFAFHAFVVEDSRLQQNRVRAKLYNCGACVCKSNVEIRIAGSFCRPQLKLFNVPKVVKFPENHITAYLDNIELRFGCFELTRIGFHSEICRSSQG